jgi:MAF protein
MTTQYPLHSQPPILLASSSPYRGRLLAQLGISFIQAAPNIDESSLFNETPHELVSRLSEQKALALSKQYDDHIIIASDQVAVTPNNIVLGKPGTVDNACKQLNGVSGQKVSFLTGLCVLSPCSDHHSSWRKQLIVEPYYVYFRRLSHTQIRNYVERENPLDCAGSFKSEGLGISLFEKLEGDDPNALIGLPLIRLCSMLDNINVSVLAKA